MLTLLWLLPFCLYQKLWFSVCRCLWVSPSRESRGLLALYTFTQGLPVSAVWEQAGVMVEILDALVGKILVEVSPGKLFFQEALGLERLWALVL